MTQVHDSCLILPNHEHRISFCPYITVLVSDASDLPITIFFQQESWPLMHSNADACIYNFIALNFAKHRLPLAACLLCMSCIVMPLIAPGQDCHAVQLAKHTKVLVHDLILAWS